jgi:hypothetical protein
VFWYQERVKSASLVSKRKIVYNLCCRSGKINFEPYKKPPAPLPDLLQFDGDARSKRFLRQIRSYNSLFGFTSLGANIDKTINNGTAPYVFKINGVVHHRIGTSLPRHGIRPKFAQLYIYDTEHEAQNRLGIFEIDDRVADQPEPDIVMSLLGMLNEHNQLVKAFRWAQRMMKKQVDTLIASNPRGFLPDDITRLLEKVYIWNASFTENSKDSIEECFQVNAFIEEVNDASALPATPTRSQSSSLCSLRVLVAVCKALLKKALPCL